MTMAAIGAMTLPKMAPKPFSIWGPGSSSQAGRLRAPHTSGL